MNYRLSIVFFLSLALMLAACRNGVEAQATPTPTVAASPTAAPEPTPTIAPSPTAVPDPLADIEPAERITVLYPAIIPSDAMEAAIASFGDDIGSGIEVEATPYTDTATLASMLDDATPSLIIADALPATVEGIDLAPFIQSSGRGLDDDAAEALVAAGPVTVFPVLSSVMVLYYDPDLLEEMNVELPTTWPQLVRTACSTHDKERTGAVVYPDARLFAALVAANGGTLYDGETITVDSEAAVTAAEQLAALTKDDCGVLTGRPYGNEPPPLSGPPLFAFGPIGQPPLAVPDPNNPDPIAVAPLPIDGIGPATIMLAGTVTAEEDAEQLAAWLFLRWLRDAAQQSALAEATGLLPTSEGAIVPGAVAPLDDAVDFTAAPLAPLPEESRLLIEEGLVQIMGGADAEQTLGYLAELLMAQE